MEVQYRPRKLTVEVPLDNFTVWDSVTNCEVRIELDSLDNRIVQIGIMQHPDLAEGPEAKADITMWAGGLLEFATLLKLGLKVYEERYGKGKA